MSKLFAEGGSTMYYVLLGGLAGLGVCIVQFVMMRRLNLLPVLCGIIAYIFFMGSFGHVTGLIQAYEGVGGAMPEERSVLLSRGLAVAFNPKALALGLCALLSFLGAIAGLIRAFMRPAPQ